ncbi:MAG: lipase family protein [Clostridiales bacterium]|nr:lipase family protein [Clostridiales bacterium]
MIRKRLINAIDFSGNAYQDIKSCTYGREIIKINDISGTQCYIGILPPFLRITFRGTDSDADWRLDMRFWKKRIPYDNKSSKIRVHSGFINAYKSDDVRLKIHKYITDDICNIQITGHSLGGALAVLCAVDLQYNFPEKDYEVVIFGCPRVGNAAFARSYNKRVFNTIRVENGNDIVTKLPPAILGYRHVGVKFKIGNWSVPGVVSFKSHKIQRYYKNLIKRLY